MTKRKRDNYDLDCLSQVPCALTSKWPIHNFGSGWKTVCTIKQQWNVFSDSVKKNILYLTDCVHFEVLPHIIHGLTPPPKKNKCITLLDKLMKQLRSGSVHFMVALLQESAPLARKFYEVNRAGTLSATGLAEFYGTLSAQEKTIIKTVLADTKLFLVCTEFVLSLQTEWVMCLVLLRTHLQHGALGFTFRADCGCKRNHQMGNKRFWLSRLRCSYSNTENLQIFYLRQCPLHVPADRYYLNSNEDSNKATNFCILDTLKEFDQLTVAFECKRLGTECIGLPEVLSTLISYYLTENINFVLSK